MAETQRPATEAELGGDGLLSARRMVIPAIDALAYSIPALLWLSTALSVAYFASITYGLAVGDALPTATIFRFPQAYLIARVETRLPHALLFFAFAGGMIGWLAKAEFANEELLRRKQATATSLLSRWGLVIAGAIFVLAWTRSAGWNSGPTLPNQGSADSLFGLVPISDAHGYFVNPVQQILTGFWSEFASRRPLAAGFRQLVTTAGGFSHLGTILVQIGLIIVAFCWAARSILLWRGLWPAVAFAALIYVIARPVLSTMLTEPLALFWALMSVGFFCESMRLKSLPHAYLALTALTIAEVIRMGSLFTIPAFVIWISLAFASDWRKRLTLAGAGIAVVAAIAIVQSACAMMYGDPDAATGSNFAYTLCGLALGKNWGDCYRLFATELQHIPGERTQAAFLMSKALGLIHHSPFPMLGRMLENVQDLITGLPEFLLYGANNWHPLQDCVFIALLIPGLCIAWRNRAHGEVSFWALFFVSLAASSAIIFADDGWRVMHSTWPFVALFFSLAFVSPVTVAAPSGLRPLLSAQRGGLVIAALLVLTLIAPSTGRIWPGAELKRLAKTDAAASANSQVIAGATLTGFLVLPDGARLPRNIPSLHVSNFVTLARQLSLERDYGAFLNTAVARVPFALINAARIDAPALQDWDFAIAPPDILTKGPAPAWRIGFRRLTPVVLEASSVQPLFAASGGAN